MTTAKQIPPGFLNPDDLLRDFVLIYGTDQVFDVRFRRFINFSNLRTITSADAITVWTKDARRRVVLPEQVVFDPAGEQDPATTCNLWGGWPTKPVAGSCECLLELLEYLCSEEDNPREVFQWVLKWLAYPIQHPGAKMQTAILMHGPEGTGKNTFFGAVRAIYGVYAGIFDQVQLESQFNGWASGKLFMIGNEVVTRAELYHQQGRLKNMITEREWQVNEKHLPTRIERNHCNFVFLSNRIDIAKLDKDDRRYCVIWTPPALSETFYREAAVELAAGGAAALHDYLLKLDLGDFDAHAKPPLTRSKRELINLSSDSVDRFFDEWRGGHLDDVPFAPCRSLQLYDVYLTWAKRIGVPRPAPEYVLLAAVGKKPGVRKIRARYYKPGTCTQTQGMVILTPGAEPAEGQSQAAWLTKKIGEFAEAVEAYRNDGKP